VYDDYVRSHLLSERTIILVRDTMHAIVSAGINPGIGMYQLLNADIFEVMNSHMMEIRLTYDQSVYHRLCAVSANRKDDAFRPEPRHFVLMDKSDVNEEGMQSLHISLFYFGSNCHEGRKIYLHRIIQIRKHIPSNGEFHSNPCSNLRLPAVFTVIDI